MSQNTAYDPHSHDPLAILRPVPSFTVTSNDVTEGKPLGAAQFGASSGGSDTSPHLSWSGFPAETKSFAVTCYDPDAPTGAGFWHWAVFNIPTSVTELPTGAGSPNSGLLPEGAVTLPNEARLTSFYGAGPPEGTGVHRYIFVVHAVDVARLDVDPRSTPTVLSFNLNFHAVGRAVLTGLGEFGGAH